MTTTVPPAKGIISSTYLYFISLMLENILASFFLFAWLEGSYATTGIIKSLFKHVNKIINFPTVLDLSNGILNIFWRKAGLNQVMSPILQASLYR